MGFVDWFWVDKRCSPLSGWIGRPPRSCLSGNRAAIKTLEMSRARCELATMLSGLLVANSKEGAEQDEGDRRWSHDVDGEEFLGCHRLHWCRSKWPENCETEMLDAE